MKLFDHESLYQELRSRGAEAWVRDFESICHKRLYPEKHGNLEKWKAAWHALPDVQDGRLDASDDAVAIHSDSHVDHDALRENLLQFHPWRKGPFNLFGLHINTEWNSSLKWSRIADAVDFTDACVLDVGSGNGYYGWKMLDAGADFVLGCDPFLLYVMQYEVLARYVQRPKRHFVLPLGDVDIPDNLSFFDITCSMGVLYHRTSPIDHLLKLAGTLRPGGTLLVETLVIESNRCEVLVPERRYAKMRNVWFIPSISMLCRWLRRTGFGEVKLIDVNRTTSEEQRRTDWMTFESLSDFLDPMDASRTIEGNPGPIRATITARKKA